jgi:hypothetical protein
MVIKVKRNDNHIFKKHKYQTIKYNVGCLEEKLEKCTY